MRRFFGFVNGSFFGHVVFYELIGSLPMFVWFLTENYHQGTLTVSFTVQSALVTIAGGVVVAFAMWHTVTLPLLRRSKEKIRK
jgi:hypothetical protein